MATTITTDSGFQGFSLDVGRKVLWKSGEIVTLPPKAVEMLIVLLHNRGKVVTKQELLDAVWGDTFVEESVLSNNVYLLRKAIGEVVPGRQLIQTVPRRGYRFDDEFDDPTSEFVLEHHVFEQTLIEDVSGNDRLSTPPAELSIKHRPWLNTYTVVAACAILIAAVGLGAWRLDQNTGRISISNVHSVAVLPLQIIGDNEDDALRLRLTDSLITKLGKVDSLLVRPMTSVASFEGNGVDSLEIGRKLEVDAVLTGVAQRENDNIRLTLQLVSVDNGSQIWSEQFDGERSRMLAFEDAVSSKIFQAFHLTDGQTVQAQKRTTAIDGAQEEYVRGRYFWNKRTPEGLKSAITAFKSAIALDPNYADAYAGLADSYVLQVDYGYESNGQNIRLASANVDKAISLDPTASEAYVTRSTIEGTYGHDWSAAEASLIRALDIAPNSSTAHHRYGVLLFRLRRFAEAESQLDLAKKLDPSSPSVNMNFGVAAFFSKRLDDAQERFERAIELDSRFSAPRWYLARCLWMKGDIDASLEQYSQAMLADGDNETAQLISAARTTGGKDAALTAWTSSWEKLIGKNGINEHDLAILSAFRGDREDTIQWLQRAFEKDRPWINSIGAEPEFDFVRDDERFKAILAKLNLPV